MAKPAVVYALTATALLFFLAFSPTPHASPRRRTNRRLAQLHHIPAFDPLVGKLERRAEETGLLDLQTFQDKLDAISAHRDWSKLPKEIGELEEYFGEEARLNITERLNYLFHLLDRAPKDALISFEELDVWNQRQAMDRLIYSTQRQMKMHDKNRDGLVTLREFLSYLPDEDIDWNDKRHGKPGWWKEQFVNADKDGNGSLTENELNDFLHPEDSSQPKVQLWLLKEELREMDPNNDGKLSFAEFRDRSYDIYRNFPSFDKDEGPQNHATNSEKLFADLDVNKDKFLTAEELKPILHHLHPGELSYATYYTKYLMHESDDDRDGKLTLKEILDHHHAFYSTVIEESHDDDDLHLELR